MSLAQSTLVQRIRYELGDRPWETTGSAADATSVIAVAAGTDWVAGDVLEFPADGDTALVRSIASNDLTCVRSYWGSTGASHAASSRIYKNPRYTFMEITNAISSVINERLWPWVYKKVADTITPAPTTTVWYDLGTSGDVLGIISVRQLYGGSNEKQGFFTPSRRGAPRRFEVKRNMTTTLVTAGVGMRFPDGFYHNTNAVNVDFAAKITDTVATNAYSDFSAGEALVEAIIYGAVSHLEGALENRKPRQPRQDRETVRGAAMYEAKFSDALRRAEMELGVKYPIIAKVEPQV